MVSRGTIYMDHGKPALRKQQQMQDTYTRDESARPDSGQGSIN